MVADREKYHVVFEDPSSGETLGLLLSDAGGGIGRIKTLANPYAAKVGSGPRTLQDLTDLSAYAQAEWRGGRGQDRWEDEERFYDAMGLETRIKGQITLGPQVVTTGVGLVPEYMPTLTWGQDIGRLSQAKQERSQGFLTPAGGLSCTHVVLLLSRSGPLWGNVTVGLYADSGGLPAGSALRTCTLTNAEIPLSPGEVKCVWASAYTLVAGTTYHIAVSYSYRLNEEAYVRWHSDSTHAYADGAAGYRPRRWTVGASLVAGADLIDQGAWTADTTVDYWFKVNYGKTMAGAITVNPVRFNGKWYCAAYDTVYCWNTATSVWDVSETVAAQTVTALLTWGTYLWAARGANTMRRMTTASSWGNSPGSVQAQLLAEYQGYLYRTLPSAPSTMYYTSDGTAWSAAIAVGPGDWAVTGMAGFRDELALANAVGLWLQSVDWAYQVLSWLSQERATNGAGMVSWPKTNELLVAVGHGLYRWTGSTMVACGPDTGSGLPADRAGVVAALCPTTNWLYAAIDAGASGYSSVMAYTGGGWHEIYTSYVSGDRIRALGYETLSSPPRLWWGEGSVMKYAELPDYGDNPYSWTGLTFRSGGTIWLSSWGSELAQVVKDWRAVTVHVENCAATRTVQVFYDVDRADLWRPLGTIADTKRVHTLPFPATVFASKVVGTGSTTTTIEIDTALGPTTSDMNAGDWVRVHYEPRLVAGDWVHINDDIRQVSSVTDSNTFVLALALSAAPVAGDGVHASSPAGHEIRLALVLSTLDDAETPKVMGVVLYCDANVTDRWEWTLAVRCEDKMTCLDGSSYVPANAAVLEAAINEWITRKTPFTLHDIRGMQYTVKVSNAVESQAVRRNESPAGYDSVIRLGLVEVNLG